MREVSFSAGPKQPLLQSHYAFHCKQIHVMPQRGPVPSAWEGEEPPAKGGYASRAPRHPGRRQQTPSAYPTQLMHFSGGAQQSRSRDREENRSFTEGICGGEGNTGQEDKADMARGSWGQFLLRSPQREAAQHE